MPRSKKTFVEWMAHLLQPLRSIGLVLQSETAECGLACLAMVAGHHGNKVSLAQLRNAFSASSNGMRLDRLMEIARDIGLQPRAVRANLEDVAKLKVPAILHWNFNHYVVLSRSSFGRYEILDPAFGRRRLSSSELSQHFTGVALELRSTSQFEALRIQPQLRIADVLAATDGAWKKLAGILLLSLMVQACLLLAPLYLQRMLDSVSDGSSTEILNALALGFGGLAIFHLVANTLRSWSILALSTAIGSQLVSGSLAHLMSLPLSFFEKRRLGDIVSRLDGAKSFQRTLSSGFVESVVDGAMALATLAFMIAYSTKMTALSAGAMVAYVIARTISFGRIRRLTDEQLASSGKQQTHLLETLRGIQSIKVAGGERTRFADWLNFFVDTRNSEIRLAGIRIAVGSWNQALLGAERILVLWFGAHLMLEGALTAGMLVAYLAYKDQFLGRVSGLVDKIVDFRMLRLHADRLSDIVLAEPEQARFSDLEDSLGGEIELRNVSFRYSDDSPWILRDLSLKIEQGESIAIVGPSGCGKSTLMKLLAGLITPTEGEIYIAGRRSDKIGLNRLRRSIGAVLQEDRLFTGSIIENIAFFDAQADESNVKSAAAAASIDVEIEALPLKFNTHISEMGASLSGGQKQRIMLARALYKRPTILLLDEATSHLDVACERLVSEAIRAMKLTRVMVAHRRETIATAERVVQLRKGRVLSIAPTLQTKGLAPEVVAGSEIPSEP